MSASAVMLVWFGKKASSDIRLADLKKEAKQLGLSLLRNKDKNSFITAVASALIRDKKVEIAAGVDLHKVTQDDVVVHVPVTSQ